MSGQTIALVVTGLGGFVAGLAALWKSFADRDSAAGTVAQAQVDNALQSLGAALLRLERENTDLRTAISAASTELAVLRRRVAELEREHA